MRDVYSIIRADYALYLLTLPQISKRKENRGLWFSLNSNICSRHQCRDDPLSIRNFDISSSVGDLNRTINGGLELIDFFS